MRDRIPKYPGRVRLEPVAGQENTFDLVRADEATEPGTALNKANLLKDATAAIYGLGAEAVPDDVFTILGIGAGNYGYGITVRFADGTPASGLTVTGLSALPAMSMVTDENGYVLGISTSGSVNVTIKSPYADMKDKTVSISSTGIVTKSTITFDQTIGEFLTVETSKNITFSHRVKSYDLCAVGAGGGGANGLIAYGYQTSGGAGGYVGNLLNVQYSTADTIEIQIGAGGAVSTANHKDGYKGGDTIVKKNGTVVLRANGGLGAAFVSDDVLRAGPVGNGNGGYSGKFVNGNYPSGLIVRYGTNGTGFKFNDPSLGLAGGGGGGAGTRRDQRETSSNSGGQPNGATGAVCGYDSTAWSPATNAGPGGGGGGTTGNSSYAPAPTSGGKGIVYIRLHYA